MLSKKCKHCGRIKALEEGFYKHSDSADGYRGICKECSKEEVKRNYKTRSNMEDVDGVLLKKCREEMGLSQFEASNLIGINFYTYVALERKSKKSKKSVMDKVNRFYGIGG